VTGNYAVAPDGSQSATRLILNKGAGTTGADESTMRCSLNTTVGSTYTLSVWLKSTDGVSQQTVSLSFNGGDGGGALTVTGEWRRYQITTLSAIDANRTPRLQLRGGFGTSDTADILVWGWQQENLPFASSYIPTAGAAVTRTKDILYLAPSGNVPSDINMTFAAQIKLMGKGLNSWPRVFEISEPANKGPFIDMATGLWGGANLVGVRKTVAARFSDTSRWLDGVNIGSVWQPYQVKTYSDPVYIAGSNVAVSRDFYGHIRNLRAWFFSPTDEQMKAIR